MGCLRRKNAHDLKALCGENRDAWEVLQALSACRGGAEALDALRPYLTAGPEWQAVEELEALLGILKSGGQEAQVRLDFSVSNDLGYYSGVVFRGYLEGIPESILSGGSMTSCPEKWGEGARPSVSRCTRIFCRSAAGRKTPLMWIP